MKRLLSLLLALVCVLSITACTEPDAKSSDEKSDTQAQSADSESDTAEPAEITEDDVRAVGEGFMSAICAFDTKEMAKYADDPKKIPASLDISVLKKSMTIPDGMEAYEEEFGELFDYMLEKLKKY